MCHVHPVRGAPARRGGPQRAAARRTRRRAIKKRSDTTDDWPRIERRLLPTVRDRLSAQPAVGLLGLRQVGKTTLARALADERGDRAIYLDLERPANARQMEDAEAFLRRPTGRLVVLDEINRARHRCPRARRPEGSHTHGLHRAAPPVHGAAPVARAVCGDGARRGGEVGGDRATGARGVIGGPRRRPRSPVSLHSIFLRSHMIVTRIVIS